MSSCSTITLFFLPIILTKLIDICLTLYTFLLKKHSLIFFNTCEVCGGAYLPFLVCAYVTVERLHINDGGTKG